MLASVGHLGGSLVTPKRGVQGQLRLSSVRTFAGAVWQPAPEFVVPSTFHKRADALEDDRGRVQLHPRVGHDVGRSPDGRRRRDPAALHGVLPGAGAEALNAEADGGDDRRGLVAAGADVGRCARRRTRRLGRGGRPGTGDRGCRRGGRRAGRGGPMRLGLLAGSTVVARSQRERDDSGEDEHSERGSAQEHLLGPVQHAAPFHRGRGTASEDLPRPCAGPRHRAQGGRGWPG